MELPTLYKKDSKGKIQYWSISTEVCPTNTGARDIIVRHGKTGGKEQVTVDTVTEGKNYGKANETSAYEQADLEAKAKWTKQIERKGYVTEIALVDVDQRDGAEPMLAHRYDKYPDKITFPCYIQPKLDGHRCIAVVKDGKCKLFSRQRKPITGVPHIIEAIEAISFKTDVILDGELYNHDYKDKFEELTGFIRSQEPKEGYEAVQYHIYDTLKEGGFESRNRFLHTLFQLSVKDTDSLKYVNTEYVENEDSVLERFRFFRNLGYEGAILRNAEGEYEGKRSYNLQKVKEFDDAEFVISDVKEGRGKMKGHAIFTCQVDNGETFDVKMKGSMDRLKEIYENAETYKGMHLTVMFQEYTKNGIPRFPVGLRLREEV